MPMGRFICLVFTQVQNLKATLLGSLFSFVSMNNPTQENINTEVITGLAGFFDLLAKFDFEDQKKLKSETNSTPLV